jgi:hypothetical protein
MADGKLPDGALKVVIKSADMEEEMQHEAIEQAKKALDEFHVEKVRAWPPKRRQKSKAAPPESAAAIHLTNKSRQPLRIRPRRTRQPTVAIACSPPSSLPFQPVLSAHST